MLSRRKLKDSCLESLEIFLGIRRGITHRPPTLSTRVTYQAIQCKPEIAFQFTYVETLDVQETRGYLNYTNSLGGQSQA